jgi:Uri superfamily endonuclease
MGELPTNPGSYLLVLELENAARIQVGRLGCIDFAAGWYVYAGSAQGSGGLRARLERHRRIAHVPYWHIDYLRQRSALRAIYYAIGGQRLECHWSQGLAAHPGASLPVRGFGASDCVRGCPAHLIRLPPGMDESGVAGWLMAVLDNTSPATAGINCIW